MSLTTPTKVEKLRKALHAKAKAESEFRFYQIYDKVYREDILTHAWRLCRANGGAAGVDGQGFEEIESLGLEGWLGELAETFRNRTYRAVRCGGSGSRRPTASNGRSGSRRSGTGWCKRRWS